MRTTRGRPRTTSAACSPTSARVGGKRKGGGGALIRNLHPFPVPLSRSLGLRVCCSMEATWTSPAWCAARRCGSTSTGQTSLARGSPEWRLTVLPPSDRRAAIAGATTSSRASQPLTSPLPPPETRCLSGMAGNRACRPRAQVISSPLSWGSKVCARIPQAPVAQPHTSGERGACGLGPAGAGRWGLHVSRGLTRP